MLTVNSNAHLATHHLILLSLWDMYLAIDYIGLRSKGSFNFFETTALYKKICLIRCLLTTFLLSHVCLIIIFFDLFLVNTC